MLRQRVRAAHAGQGNGMSTSDVTGHGLTAGVTNLGPPALADVHRLALDPALYVLITYVHIDPRSTDVREGGGEFVRLENIGPAVADVSGWTLRDRAGHVVRLPGRCYIGAGQALHVHTAPGTDTSTHVFAQRRAAILNNRDGDRLELADASGRVVHVVNWEAGR